MKDFKFTGAGEYINEQEDNQSSPRSCFMTEGKYAYDTKEEYERVMGREIPS